MFTLNLRAITLLTTLFCAALAARALSSVDDVMFSRTDFDLDRVNMDDALRGGSFRMRFRCLNESVHLALRHHEELFSAGHTVTVLDGPSGSVISKYRSPRVAYVGTTEDGSIARVTFFRDGTFHAAWRASDDIIIVDPYHRHAARLSPDEKAILSHDATHVAFRFSEMPSNPNIVCPHTRQPVEFMNYLFEHDPSNTARRLMSRFSTCPTSRKGVVVGVAVDCGYVRHNGGANNSIEGLIALFNTVNLLYNDQLNINLQVGRMTVYSTCGGPDWNEMASSQGQRCGTDPDDKLSMFTAWRGCCSGEGGESPDLEAGIYHLATDCYPVIPDGKGYVVGVGYLSTACQKNTRYCRQHDVKCEPGQCYGERGYYCRAGTSMSSIIDDYWVAIGHEIGHNFGGTHKDSGLMSYNRKTDQVFVPANGVEMCAYIANTLKSPENCMFDANPVCGNGILETGEACDDTSSCCNSATCQLAPGAECSGVAGTDAAKCCSADCQIAPSSTLCGSSGYCANGYCVPSDCEIYSAGPFCGMQPANPCLEQCNHQHKCVTKNQLPPSFNVGRTGLVARNGTICSRSPLSKCSNEFPPRCLPVEDPNLFHWVTNAWAPVQCPVECGGGTQTRQVACQRKADGSVVDDIYCAYWGDKPAESQECNTDACGPYTWETVTGSCSAVCNGGTATQRTVCHAADDSVVPDAHCGTPTHTQIDCNTEPCAWQLSGWSTCSAKCNVGTSQAQYVCMSPRASMVATYLCLDARPIDSKPCNVSACAWTTADYGNCSAACGGGTHSRSVACHVVDGGALTVDDECAQTEARPAETEACNTQRCEVFSWVAHEWGRCEPCRRGTWTRAVECVGDEHGATTDDKCTASTRPKDRDACYYRCPFYQVTYGECDVACGVGNRSRSFACAEYSGKPADESYCKLENIPPSTAFEECHAGQCECTCSDYEATGDCDATTSLRLYQRQCNPTLPAGARTPGRACDIVRYPTAKAQTCNPNSAKSLISRMKVPAYAIVIGACVLVACILAVVLGAVCWRRRRAHSHGGGGGYRATPLPQDEAQAIEMEIDRSQRRMTLTFADGPDGVRLLNDEPIVL